LRIALDSFVTEDFDLRESKTKHPPLRSSHPQHRFSRKQDPKEQSDFSSYTISYPRILKKTSLRFYYIIIANGAQEYFQDSSAVKPILKRTSNIFWKSTHPLT